MQIAALRGLLASGDLAAPGIPTWVRDAHRSFDGRLLGSPPFPCHFASYGQSRGHNFYAYSEKAPGESGRALAPVVTAYLRVIEKAESDRLSLVIFFGPPKTEGTLSEHRAQFWEFLLDLHRNDKRPWPAGVPKSPTDADFMFAFGGHGLVVFANSPAYVKRRSRNVGPCLTVVITAASSFRDLGPGTARRRSAMRAIRTRLRTYDTAGLRALHESFNNFHWYVLPDGDEAIEFTPPDFSAVLS